MFSRVLESESREPQVDSHSQGNNEHIFHFSQPRIVYFASSQLLAGLTPS